MFFLLLPSTCTTKPSGSQVYSAAYDIYLLLLSMEGFTMDSSLCWMCKNNLLCKTRAFCSFVLNWHKRWLSTNAGILGPSMRNFMTDTMWHKNNQLTKSFPKSSHREVLFACDISHQTQSKRLGTADMNLSQADPHKNITESWPVSLIRSLSPKAPGHDIIGLWPNAIWEKAMWLNRVSSVFG